MSNEEITLEQIEKMKHAVGLDHKRPSRGKYEAYRNYSMYYEDEPTWEAIVGKGLAEKTVAGKSSVYYSLNQRGLDLLGRIMNCKIKERE